MGYYTKFDMEITNANGRFLNEEEEHQIVKILGKCIYDEGDIDCSLYDFFSYDVMHWYAWRADMESISSRFPNYYFTLTGRGEDEEDWWIAKFHNGASVVKYAILLDISNEEVDREFAKKKFIEALTYVNENFGVEYGEGADERVPAFTNIEGAWYICPECGEPIYFCDWADEDNFMRCPICHWNYETCEYESEEE